eukprot:10340026-Karenia_brevis.AAC.1
MFAEHGFDESIVFFKNVGAEGAAIIAFVKLASTSAAGKFQGFFNGFAAWSQVEHKELIATWSSWEEFDALNDEYDSRSSDESITA